MNRVLLALLALAAIAYAQHEHHHPSANAISCVQCKSEVDVDCDSTGEVLAKYNKVCHKLHGGALDGTEAIGCRKILQKVNDEHNVIRECAYGGDNVDGQRRTGNSGIVLFYYQCNNGVDAVTGLPCNGVSGFSLFASSLVAVVARILM